MGMAARTRPDTALTRAAEDLLVAASAPTLVAHCHRSYLFGSALLDKAGRDHDAHALFLAAALHDLGLTAAWDDPAQPFEVRGAAVAHEHLLRWGADVELADVVRDAIAGHLDPATVGDPRPEVAGLILGALVDVLGVGLADVPAALVDEVLTAYPRAGFTAFIIDVLRAEAAAKPASTIAAHIRNLDFLGRVAAAPFPD